MILAYHKVDLIAPTTWWVTSKTFAKQMDALVGWDVVHLSEYQPGREGQCVITFDDAYENIVRHALPALKERGLPFEVFINGDFLGRWNQWDADEPTTRLCGLVQLHELAAGGGRIQWHTRSHPDLTALQPDALDHELDIPEYLRREFPAPHLQWFAYPFGSYSPTALKAVRERFDGAVAVLDGNLDDPFCLTRIVATEGLDIPARG